MNSNSDPTEIQQQQQQGSHEQRYEVIDGNHRRTVLVVTKYRAVDITSDVLKEETPPEIREELALLYNKINQTT